MNFSLKIVLNYFKTIACSAVILLLSVLPSGSLPKVPIFPNMDKLVHFLLYFVLALCFFAERKISNRSCWATKFVTPTLFPIIFGVAMEFLQLFAKGRSASLLDVAANACGAIVAMLIFILLTQKRI